MVQHSQRLNSTNLNYKLIIFFRLQIFPVLKLNSLCKTIFLIFLENSLCFPCLEKWTSKFPVFPVPWQPCEWILDVHSDTVIRVRLYWHEIDIALNFLVMSFRWVEGKIKENSRVRSNIN